MQIHNLASAQVYEYLDSRPDGLHPQEVEARRLEVGANTLEISRGLWWLVSLGRQFTNFFTILLIISAAICFVADRIQPGERMDVLGFALLGVSVLNALFSFIQEYRAERAMEELRKFLPQRVLVRRAGETVEVLAEALVPGDVLVVREGDKIPADARLVEGDDLLVNNAPLTGESRPVALSPEPSTGRLQDSANLVFAGCTVLRGSGVAVVFATAFRTEFGKIALLSHETPRVVSPLEHKTSQMVRVLTIIAVSMGVGFFIYGIFTERSLWVNLVFMMGIIVANVPEGLLPTFTLSLAMGSLRMARRNVLVKGLTAVEAMGAVQVVCTDKTGTLTLNRLAVTRVAGPLSEDDLAAGAGRQAVLGHALIASEVRETDSGFSGDPLDVAIAEALTAGGTPIAERLSSPHRHFAFDADKRRAAGIASDNGRALFAVKGAWESLRPLITRIEGPASGQSIAAEGDALAHADAVVHRLASRGQRVITVAYRALDAGLPDEATQDSLETDLILAGFLGLEDPLRPEVPEAVARCHEAGIRMVMVTGDHPDTAEAIARQAGMLPEQEPSSAATLIGDELTAMRERDLIEHLQRGVTVFARTTPEQKMKIVSALHAMDLVVAVTGDGVNDAPALKAADIGIAMGRTGTDVAREAAQVILLDDNFASIVSGVEEGRTVFNNISKFTNYVLVSNGPEIAPYLLYIVLPVPLALTIIQILSIDLGTDIVPSMALGREKPDPDVMKQPPRARRQGLLTLPLMAHSYLFLGLIEATFALALFFWVLTAGGWEYGQELSSQDPLCRSATGITLSSIILMQIGNLIGRRSRYGSGIDRGILENPLTLAGIGLEILFSWAILYFPPVAAVLGTGPVDLHVYGAAWLGVPLIFGLDYVRKKIAARMARPRSVVAKTA